MLCSLIFLVVTARSDVISQPNTMTQTISIDAPIIIHTFPGIDTKAIADEVQKALAQHEQRGAVHSRAFLYDTANA